MEQLVQWAAIIPLVGLVFAVGSNWRRIGALELRFDDNQYWIRREMDGLRETLKRLEDKIDNLR